MEKIYLNVESRTKTGKEFSKKTRASGAVPAVLCKKGKPSASLLVNEKELFKSLHTKAGENVILTLKMKGEENKPSERTVIVKDVQYHPITDNIVHVDFNEISLTEVLKVKVPLSTKGEAVGVKAEGGVMERVLWELEIECLPVDIPGFIEVDVANLKIGDSIAVKDIAAPKGVKILNDPEIVAVTVKHPHVEKPPEEAVEAAAEPELIREKKEVEEEAEEGAEKKEEAKPQKPAGAAKEEKPKQ